MNLPTLSTTLRPAALSVAALATAGALTGCGAASAHTTATDSTSASASADPSPTSSSPAGDDHDGLPALLPQLTEDDSTVIGVGQSRTLSDGVTLALTGRLGGPDGEVHHGRIVVTKNGVTRSAAVPSGWGPALFTVPVRFDGSDGPGGSDGSDGSDGSVGYVLSQEGGDSDRREVYVADPTDDHALVAATVTGDAPFGGGFVDDGKYAFMSWETQDGTGLFTSVGDDGAPKGGVRVYRWSLDGTRLVPRDLGYVCFHYQRTSQSYDRC